MLIIHVFFLVSGIVLFNTYNTDILRPFEDQKRYPAARGGKSRVLWVPERASCLLFVDAATHAPGCLSREALPVRRFGRATLALYNNRRMLVVVSPL